MSSPPPPPEEAPSSADLPPSSQVRLESSDGRVFAVDREVAEKSALVKNLLEDVGESDVAIPMQNVTGAILAKVLEYCEHHRGENNDNGSDGNNAAPPASSADSAGAGGASSSSSSSASADPDLADARRRGDPDDMRNSMDDWDRDFCAVDQETLFELILVR